MFFFFLKNEAFWFFQPALMDVYSCYYHFYKSYNVLPHTLQCLKISSTSVKACQKYGKSSQKCPEGDGFSLTFDLRHIICIQKFYRALRLKFFTLIIFVCQFKFFSVCSRKARLCFGSNHIAMKITTPVA